MRRSTCAHPLHAMNLPTRHAPQTATVRVSDRFEVRYVSANGGIRWESSLGQRLHHLRQRYVILEEIDDGEVWNVSFAPLKLARLLERTQAHRRCSVVDSNDTGDCYPCLGPILLPISLTGPHHNTAMMRLDVALPSLKPREVSTNPQPLGHHLNPPPFSDIFDLPTSSFLAGPRLKRVTHLTRDQATWNGTSVTMMPGLNSNAQRSHTAVWLCRTLCHQLRGTNCGITTVMSSCGWRRAATSSR